jgi:hypothetical protein
MNNMINADTGDTLEILKNITPSTMSNDALPSESYSDSATESFKIGGNKPVSNSNNKTFNEIKQLYHEVYGI